MTDNSCEKEILSTFYDADEDAKCLLSMRKGDQKAGEIAETIIKLKSDLKNLQSICGSSKTNEQDICCIKKKLATKLEEYKTTIDDVLNLAKKINFDVENLEYRKIDINKNDKCLTHIDATNIVRDNEEDLLAPVIIINDDNPQKPKIFVYDKINKCSDDECESICGCTDNSECDDNSDCEEDDRVVTNNCIPCIKTENDYEKEAIRDDLLTMKGEVKLLQQQNRDLLCKLNSDNERNVVLSSALRNKPVLGKCQDSKNVDEQGNIEMNIQKSETKILLKEINRLEDELKKMKRDRCQIELARKVLNVSETQCANCLESVDQGVANINKLKQLTAAYNTLVTEHNCRLSEIDELQEKLNKEKCSHQCYEENLLISKTQIEQLEKELFDLKSAKTDDPEVTCSNQKYQIENLKYRLLQANEENTSMQMVLDFHLSELEDKKSKYLAVLQTNEEQKQRIESLCNEKMTISKEYEAEFNRMNEHLLKRLKEIEELPGLLANAQRDLANERSAKMKLENERGVLLNEIETMKSALLDANVSKNEMKIKEMEEENKQLKAMIKILNDKLAENKRLYTERTHYSLQLKEHLDVAREESAIQITKLKNFSECQKIKYTEYIQKLEQQLAESRALACAEFKKRDSVDERLRNRIEVLTKNLNEANQKVGELINAKNMIDTIRVDDKCKIPRGTKTSCENVDKS